MLNAKTLQKAISAVTMFATVVCLSGVSMLAPLTASATGIVDGDIVKTNAVNSDGTPAVSSLDVYIVKIVGTKKFKRLVLNPNIFASYGHLKWENLKTISQTEIDGYTTSSLVRVDGDSKVWALTPVTGGDTGAKSWINVTAEQFIDEADSDPDSIYTINGTDAAAYSAKADITTVAQLKAFYADGTLPDTLVGDIVASLAATTPASGTLVTGQGTANLAEFKLTGTGTVKSVTLKRTGVSADTTFSNVYLFDGETRLTDAASVSSGSLITFTDASKLFDVSGSKTISVRADIATGTSGQTVGVDLTGITTAAGSIAGLPVSGNIHSIASATLATVAMSAATGSGNTDPGEDITVWQGTATVGSRDVLLNRLALRQIGSIASADIKNFTLFVDGVEADSVASLDSNGYVTFDEVKTLKTGARILKVTADVIGGSGRTVQMSLRGAYDISTTDTQYNAGVLATGTFPFGPAAFTVNAGTMTVVKATNSQSGDVTKGASDVSLATFDFTAYGEAVKVETLTLDIDQTGGVDANVTLQNVRLMVDGAQVGSTTSVPVAIDTAFTTNFTVYPGTPAKVEVRADIADSNITTGTAVDDIAAGTVTAIQATLAVGSGNAIPKVSLGTINVPSAATAGNSLTIATGSISLAKTSNYTNQIVVLPATAFKIGSFQLSGNSTEKVNLNTLELDFTGADAFDPSDDLADLYIKYGANQTSVKGTVADTDNTWSINHELGLNATLQVEVYANVKSTATDGDVDADTIIAALTATGVTASSSATVYADSNSSNSTKDAGFAGQTITVGTGTLTATLDASAAPAAIVADQQTVPAAAFKFTTTNDSYTVTDITLTIAEVTNVANVILKVDGVAIAGGTKPGAATVTYSGLAIPVAANDSEVVTVDLELGTVGAGAGTTGASILTTLTDAFGRNSSGTAVTVTESDPAGNAIYVYKATPTIASQTLPSSVLGAGTKTLAKFTVASNGGTIAWKQVLLDVTKTAAPTVTGFALYDVTSGSAVAVTAAIVVQNADGASATALANDTTYGEILISVGTNADDNVEQQVSGSKTYELRATIGGTIADSAYVTTSIAQNLGHVSSAAYTSVDNDTTVDDASFVWSDVSAIGHDTGTLDWANEYLVKNLPTDSQTLTK